MDKEREGSEPTKEESTRDSYPMQCISQAISYEEKIQIAISVIEDRVSILLLPSSPAPKDESGEKEPVRSLLITELGNLQLKQIESLDQLESLAARLDL